MKDRRGSGTGGGQNLPAEIIEATRAVYRELASRPIERSCTSLAGCCHFKQTGRTPFLTKAEAMVAAKALRSTGRKGLPESPEGACPLLHQTSGKCLIYDSRPFGCRTHFCAAAGGPYARREVADLIHRLEILSSRIGGREAQPLPSAIRSALEEF